MKPRNSVYRILARCKAAKHGKTEKAKRMQENAKIAQELGVKHSRVTRDIDKAWRAFAQDY